MDCLCILSAEQHANDVANAHLIRIDALTVDKYRHVARVWNTPTIDDDAAEACDRANDAGPADTMVVTTDDGLAGTSDAMIVRPGLFRGVGR